MGINNLVWFNYDLVRLIMIVMIFCSFHYFSTHTCDSTSHWAALTNENLPSGTYNFWIVVVSLLGVDLWKSHFFTQFITMRFRHGWLKYLNILFVVKVIVKFLPCLKFWSNSYQEPLKKTYHYWNLNKKWLFYTT